MIIPPGLDEAAWWEAVYASMRSASECEHRQVTGRDAYVYDNFGPCQHGDPYRRDE